MRKLFALSILAVALSGCKTALIYTGSVKAGDDQKARAVARTIEEEYVRQGLKLESVFPSETEAFYATAWVKPVGNTRYITLWVSNTVKDGKLLIRIVPQPYCDDTSRVFGEHMRGFMTTTFPELDWNLVSRTEQDWFR